MTEKILVIDDESVVLDTCRKIFSKEGYEVLTTQDPAQGLKMAQEDNCQVILLDWQMPGFDGLDVLKELEEKAPNSAIVMFSGFPSVGRASESMKRGAMDYLPKPFTPEEIVQTVQKARRRKQEQENKTLTQVGQLVKNFTAPPPPLVIDARDPKTVAETIAKTVSVAKATNTNINLTILGLLAGAYIAFGGMFFTVSTVGAADALGFGPARLLGGVTFSLGLMLVVVAGAELFTGNNLMLASFASGHVSWKRMMNNWIVVWLANFAGSVLVAYLYYASGLWKMANSGVGESAVRIASAKLSLGTGEAFIRAIGCNWLVCLAVWMGLAARQVTDKFFAIILPISGFVAIGFEHCVANMYFIPLGLTLSAAGVAPAGVNLEVMTWGNFLVGNLLPVTLGNIIGGAVFVGMSYWGVFLRQLPTSKPA